MIISQKHEYLFIEVPLTASWAIRHELCEHYAGKPILHKHASYPEFLKDAGARERDFFVFASVRNPLDVAVSQYVKYKTNHKEAFSQPGALKQLRVEQADLKKFRFIQERDAEFEAYFLRFHRRPYRGAVELSREHLDFVIRYESLQQDFSQVLRRLEIKQVGPVPVMNRTRGKRHDWASYYTPEVIDQAKNTFGPFMRRWGYEFPSDWGPTNPRWRDEVAFRLFGAVQRLYQTNVRYSRSVHAKVIRSLRAWLTA